MVDVPSNLGTCRVHCLACPVDCGVACCIRPGACCMCCNVHVSTCVFHATCRLCKATGATALARIGGPTPEELGSATSVEVRAVLCLPQRMRQCTCVLATRASVWSVFSCWHARTRSGFGSLRRGWLRSQQDRSAVTVGRAGCLVCCNVHRSMQQVECNPACVQQAVSTPAAQSRPVCMAVRALAGGRDRRHKVHCGHVGPRGLPFESALAGGADLARIGLAPIVPTAPMVPQTTAPKRAVAAQGVHTRHFEIQPRPLPCGCEHRPAHRQPHTAPLTCRPTVLCAVASQPCGSVGLWAHRSATSSRSCCAGRRRITSTTSSARSRTVRCSTRTGPCCAVRVLVVLLGATEQSAHIAATE